SAHEQVSDLAASLKAEVSAMRDDLERQREERERSVDREQANELRDVIARSEAERQILIDELAAAGARASEADTLAVKAGMLEEVIANDRRSSASVLLQNSLLSVEVEKERARRALRKRREKVFRELRNAERQVASLGLGVRLATDWDAADVSKKDRR